MRSPSPAQPAARDFFSAMACRRLPTAAWPSIGPQQLLREGKIVAIKGLGGYHLACDARNAEANAALRERKFRKEKPFAVMARDLETARTLVELSPEAEALLQSIARPIVLAPKKQEFPGVAPDNNELGVMLPYTPLQHLLFAAGAPDCAGHDQREPLQRTYCL